MSKYNGKHKTKTSTEYARNKISIITDAIRNNLKRHITTPLNMEEIDRALRRHTRALSEHFDIPIELMNLSFDQNEVTIGLNIDQNRQRQYIAIDMEIES